MGNIIKIKHGTLTPPTGSLEEYELGYKVEGSEPAGLYIGTSNGVVSITGSNAIFSSPSSGDSGTGATSQLKNGESGANIYPVIRGGDLVEEVPIEQGGTSATNVLSARANFGLNTPSFEDEVRLSDTTTTSATAGMKMEYYMVNSQKRVRIMEI
jgi:hypothetical protein